MVSIWWLEQRLSGKDRKYFCRVTPTPASLNSKFTLSLYIYYEYPYVLLSGHWILQYFTNCRRMPSRMWIFSSNQLWHLNILLCLRSLIYSNKNRKLTVPHSFNTSLGCSFFYITCIKYCYLSNIGGRMNRRIRAFYEGISAKNANIRTRLTDSIFHSDIRYSAYIKNQYKLNMLLSILFCRHKKGNLWKIFLCSVLRLWAVFYSFIIDHYHNDLLEYISDNPTLKNNLKIRLIVGTCFDWLI